MRILILGAGGMAGHVIAVRLAELGHHIVGIARRELDFCPCRVLDVTEEDALKQIIETGAFDAIVNAVGILPKGIHADPANGIWINAYLPHMLETVTKDMETRVIQLSTDCVFSGQDRGNYTEQDFPNATDYYGRSKILGELNDHKNLTLRTSIIGPDINKNGVGLFHWFMKQSQTVNGFEKVIWTGVSTITLSEAIHQALAQNLTGLYQLVNHQTINKYELLKLFNGLRKNPVEIRKDGQYVSDKSLVCTRSDFAFTVPSYQNMVYEMGSWIRGHKQFYPDYDIEVGE